MANGVILNYSNDVYKQKISSLETHAGRLSGMINDLEDYQNELKNYWDDDQALQFYKLISTELRSARTALSNVERLKTLYSNTVGEISNLTSAVENVVDTASTAIQAMGIGGE